MSASASAAVASAAVASAAVASAAVATNPTPPPRLGFSAVYVFYQNENRHPRLYVFPTPPPPPPAADTAAADTAAAGTDTAAPPPPPPPAADAATANFTAVEYNSLEVSDMSLRTFKSYDEFMEGLNDFPFYMFSVPDTNSDEETLKALVKKYMNVYRGVSDKYKLFSAPIRDQDEWGEIERDIVDYEDPNHMNTIVATMKQNMFLASFMIAPCLLKCFDHYPDENYDRESRLFHRQFSFMDYMIMCFGLSNSQYGPTIEVSSTDPVIHNDDGNMDNPGEQKNDITDVLYKNCYMKRRLPTDVFIKPYLNNTGEKQAVSYKYIVSLKPITRNGLAMFIFKDSYETTTPILDFNKITNMDSLQTWVKNNTNALEMFAPYRRNCFWDNELEFLCNLWKQGPNTRVYDKSWISMIHIDDNAAHASISISIRQDTNDSSIIKIIKLYYDSYGLFKDVNDGGVSPTGKYIYTTINLLDVFENLLNDTDNDAAATDKINLNNRSPDNKVNMFVQFALSYAMTQYNNQTYKSFFFKIRPVHKFPNNNTEVTNITSLFKRAGEYFFIDTTSDKEPQYLCRYIPFVHKRVGTEFKPEVSVDTNSLWSRLKSRLEQAGQIFIDKAVIENMQVYYGGSNTGIGLNLPKDLVKELTDADQLTELQDPTEYQQLQRRNKEKEPLTQSIPLSDRGHDEKTRPTNGIFSESRAATSSNNQFEWNDDDDHRLFADEAGLDNTSEDNTSPRAVGSRSTLSPSSSPRSPTEPEEKRGDELLGSQQQRTYPDRNNFGEEEENEEEDVDDEGKGGPSYRRSSTERRSRAPRTTPVAMPARASSRDMGSNISRLLFYGVPFFVPLFFLFSSVIEQNARGVVYIVGLMSALVMCYFSFLLTEYLWSVVQDTQLLSMLTASSDTTNSLMGNLGMSSSSSGGGFDGGTTGAAAGTADDGGTCVQMQIVVGSTDYTRDMNISLVVLAYTFMYLLYCAVSNHRYEHGYADFPRYASMFVVFLMLALHNVVVSSSADMQACRAPTHAGGFGKITNDVMSVCFGALFGYVVAAFVRKLGVPELLYYSPDDNSGNQCHRSGKHEVSCRVSSGGVSGGVSGQ